MSQKHLVHFWKSLMGFCAFLEVLLGIVCIFGSSSWFFFGILEIPHWMFYIFGRSSSDFVHFWKFFMGFVEVSHGIFGSSSWDFVHILGVLYYMLYIFGSFSLNFFHFWKFSMGFVEVSHEIFGSFSWDFVHI